jgi:hypothetical protein
MSTNQMARPLEWGGSAACMIGLSGVCVVGDRVQVLALPCSTPLGCEGSTPLLIGPGTRGWEEDRQLVPLWSLLPCCATAWDALIYPKNKIKNNRLFTSCGHTYKTLRAPHTCQTRRGQTTRHGLDGCTMQNTLPCCVHVYLLR